MVTIEHYRKSELCSGLLVGAVEKTRVFMLAAEYLANFLPINGVLFGTRI